MSIKSLAIVTSTPGGKHLSDMCNEPDGYRHECVRRDVHEDQRYERVYSVGGEGLNPLHLTSLFVLTSSASLSDPDWRSCTVLVLHKGDREPIEDDYNTMRWPRCCTMWLMRRSRDPLVLLPVVLLAGAWRREWHWL